MTDDANTPGRRSKRSPRPKKMVLPAVAVPIGAITRLDVRRRRELFEGQRKSAEPDCRLPQVEERTISHLEAQFIPRHGASQLISPRDFLTSRLFRACSRAVARQPHIEMIISSGISYTGPELRQSDGLVFMTLLNLARNVTVGSLVEFSPKEVCEAIYQRYDGPARKQLATAIKRLQMGVIEFQSLSVQLCLEFNFPRHGWWSVGLHRRIIELFHASPRIWLSLGTRLALPEGITTWLYSYIQCHAQLIPVSVERLRTMCGNEAELRAFENNVRISLKRLIAHEIIDEGARISGGFVRWRKRKTIPEASE